MASRTGHTTRSPRATVDTIIELDDGRIVLIERRYAPHGWALPGGFIEYGESAATAARREAREETGLDADLVELFHVYSDPDRDPRFHTLSVVFIGRAHGEPRASNDAAAAAAFSAEEPPSPLCFDHGRILSDYLRYRRTGERPHP